MGEFTSAINEAFQGSQEAVESHRALALGLQKVHRSALDLDGGSNAFYRDFVRCVDRILTLSRRDLTGTRVTEFVAEYARCISKEESDSDEDEEDEIAEQYYFFIEQLIRRYITGFTAPNAGVRFQCVRLVGKILPFAAIDDTVFTQISDSAINRLQDADSHVRNQAVILVSSLELTDNTKAALRESMVHDPSSEVRLVATYNIAHDGQQIVESVVDRIRDSSAIIRRAMYAKILKSIDMRHLTIKSRVKIVRCGLNDCDETVRKAAASLVAGSWVSKHGNNVAVVLEKLDPVANPEVADLVLRTFFEMRRDIVDKLAFPQSVSSAAADSSAPESSSEESILDYGFTAKFFENLWVDDVLMLRGFQEFCVRERLNDQLEAGMPELFVLANEIEKLVEKLWDPQAVEMSEVGDPDEWLENLPFMIEQLLLVASRYDLDDEAGRQRITTVTNNIITSSQAPTERTIEHIVAIQRRLNAASDTAFVSWAFETLTSIPSATASQMPTTEMQNSSVLTDMLRAVVIFRSVLSLVSSRDLAVYLPSIFEEHLEEPLQSPFLEIRVPALECLALAMLLDEGFAEEHFEELMKSAHKGLATIEQSEAYDRDDLLVREACIGASALADLILNSDKVTEESGLLQTTKGGLHNNDNILGDLSHYHAGDDTHNDAANGSEADITKPEQAVVFPYSRLNEIIDLHISLLESATPKLQGVVALNLAKLVLSGRVIDSDQILEKLLTLYFHNEPLQESNEDIALMQQQLTLFLRAYTLYDKGKFAVAAIFKSVCENFLKVKAGSSLSATLGSLITKLLELTAPVDSKSVSQVSTHAFIAKDLLDWIYTSNESAVRRSAANVLSKVVLEHTSVDSLAELLAIIEENASALSEMTATMSNAVQKFEERLLTVKERLATDLSRPSSSNENAGGFVVDQSHTVHSDADNTHSRPVNPDASRVETPSADISHTSSHANISHANTSHADTSHMNTSHTDSVHSESHPQDISSANVSRADNSHADILHSNNSHANSFQAGPSEHSGLSVESIPEANTHESFEHVDEDDMDVDNMRE